MNVSGIHHVGLIVGDLDRAAWFYGQVLGLQQKPRPSFGFPGLFYNCGDQEVHLTVSARPLKQEELFFRIGHCSDISRRYINRHAALVVSDLAVLESRLKEHGIEILFGPHSAKTDDSDTLVVNLVERWKKLYGTVPLFCLDPFGNLLEFLPKRAVADSDFGG